MKLDKVITRLIAALDNPAELRRAARALGNELPRHRLDVLRSFRAKLARISVAENSFTAGYLAAMLDVSAEFETSVRQGEDMHALEQLTVREGLRELLLALDSGPKLPSELAIIMGKDRSAITHALKRLRVAGLIEAHSADMPDGRLRPHRLTVVGRRVAATLQADISAELERGIRVAVALFQHVLTHPASAAGELDAIAADKLADAGAARAAVDVWAEETRNAGIIAERNSDAPQLAHGTVPHSDPLFGTSSTPRFLDDELSNGVPQSVVDPGSDALWEQIPGLLQQLDEHKERDVPVYVRTDDAGWGAWAFALHESDRTGQSRTIVNGDILSRAVAPPPSRFALVYDDPTKIYADSNQPAMREFLDRADDKFVVTAGEDDVPEGFIQLRMFPEPGK